MKTIFLAFLMLSPLTTLAQDIGYEIPPDTHDIRVPPVTGGDGQVFAKIISCYDQKMTVMYRLYTRDKIGSRLLAVCQVENLRSVEACNGDNSIAAKACTASTISFYNIKRLAKMKSDLEGFRESEPVESTSPARPAPDEDEPAAAR